MLEVSFYRKPETEANINYLWEGTSKLKPYPQSLKLYYPRNNKNCQNKTTLHFVAYDLTNLNTSLRTSHLIIVVKWHVILLLISSTLSNYAKPTTLPIKSGVLRFTRKEKCFLFFNTFWSGGFELGTPQKKYKTFTNCNRTSLARKVLPCSYYYNLTL